MIDVNQLTEKDVGRNVIYDPAYVAPRLLAVREVGQLTSWNDTFVFVRFNGPGGEACVPEDVRFEFPSP